MNLQDSTTLHTDDNLEGKISTSLITNNSSLSHILILRCVDKPSSSLPSWLTLTEDTIRASLRILSSNLRHFMYT
jgi:hypothetical protein